MCIRDRAKLTADVNLRRGAGTNYGVIKVIGTGTTVTVTDASNSQWYKVKLSDGTEGYLAAQYLKITSGDINSVKPGNSGDDNTNNGNNSNAPATDEMCIRDSPCHALLRAEYPHASEL